MGLLSADRIQAIYEAAVVCGLAPQLEAILAGLPPAYVATVPQSGPPAARLLQTLYTLNGVPALVDGTVPLAVWLRNATALAAARTEGSVFEEALAELRTTLRTPTPAIKPTISALSLGSAAVGPSPWTSANGRGRPARIFISYSHADEAHRKRLDVHLAPLKREGLIAPWHDRMIPAGVEWAGEIDRNLTEADIVLLLVSADFVASDYCFEKELRLALDRHERGETRAIPIFVEPTDFGGMPFATLQGLPRDAKPVSTWGNRDEAWLDVAKGIRAVVKSLGAATAQTKPAASYSPAPSGVDAQVPRHDEGSALTISAVLDHLEAAFPTTDWATGNFYVDRIHLQSLATLTDMLEALRAPAHAFGDPADADEFILAKNAVRRIVDLWVRGSNDSLQRDPRTGRNPLALLHAILKAMLPLEKWRAAIGASVLIQPILIKNGIQQDPSYRVKAVDATTVILTSRSDTGAEYHVPMGVLTMPRGKGLLHARVERGTILGYRRDASQIRRDNERPPVPSQGERLPTPPAANAPPVDQDRAFMRMAIDEARKSKPEDQRVHPLVGAVLVRDGKVLAVAHRGELGPGEHGEFTLLEKKLADATLVDATVYVTLEPCTTRTHPKVSCARRLLERKVGRVVIGMVDPDPRISGRGISALRGGRVEIAHFPDDLAAEVEELNRNFIRSACEAPSTLPPPAAPAGAAVQIAIHNSVIEGDVVAGDKRSK